MCRPKRFGTAKWSERVGQTVIIRNGNGEVKKYHEVPEDIQLTSNGKPVTLWDLKPG